MPSHYLNFVTAGALTLALSGCAAVPLAHMAMTQMTPQPVCLATSACPVAGSFGDISKGFGDSLRKLTTLVADNQPSPAAVPAK